MNYTEKQIRVFEGVLALARQGVDLHGLKVEQIARSAGLGKGTLYEYFSSKEEILAGAVCWSLETLLTRLEELLEQPGDFAAHTTALLAALHDTLQCDGIAYRSLAGAESGEMTGLACRFTASRPELLARLAALEAALIAQGRAEGAIRPAWPEDYCRCVVETALLAAAAAAQSPCAGPVGPENLCRMVCRALA